jgi:hypothetical protein
MSQNTHDTLRQIAQLIRDQKTEDAKRLVGQVLKIDPQNPDAWFFASVLTEDVEKKVKILERVLTLAPEHKAARRMLDRLRPPSEFEAVVGTMLSSAPAHSPSRRTGASINYPRSQGRLLIGIAVSVLLVIVVATAILVLRPISTNSTPVSTIDQAAMEKPTSSQQAVLPQMYLKHGLTFRYPATWTIEPQETGSIQFQSNNTDPQNISKDFLLIETKRPVQNLPCLNPALKDKGVTENSGNVLVEPGGIFSTQESHISGLTALFCTYNSNNTTAQHVLITVSDTSTLSILAYSTNRSAFESIFKQVIDTINIDKNQMDDWWLAPPTLKSLDEVRDKHNECLAKMTPEQRSEFESQADMQWRAHLNSPTYSYESDGELYGKANFCTLDDAFLDTAAIAWLFDSEEQRHLHAAIAWPQFLKGWRKATANSDSGRNGGTMTQAPAPTSTAMTTLPTKDDARVDSGTPNSARGTATAVNGLGPIPTLDPVLLPTDPPLATLPPGDFTIGNTIKIIGVGMNGLNVRSQPGVGSTIKFHASEEELFILKDGPRFVSNDEWWLIEDPTNSSRVGWASRRFLQNDLLPKSTSVRDRPILKVTARYAKLFTGPDDSFSIILTMGNGETAFIIGRNEDASWWLVEYKSRRGWVKNDPADGNSQGDTSNVPLAKP